MNGELARKIALDCSKRCTYTYKGPVDEFGMPIVDKIVPADSPSQIADQTSENAMKHSMALNYAEQVCSSRCTAKWLQSKQVIDEKIKG